MVVNVTPSGKAPPGRLRSWVGAMALVTAFPCRRPRVARRQQRGTRRGRPAQRARGRGRQLHHSRRAPASGSSRCRRSALPWCASRTRRPVVSAGSTDTTPHKHLKRD